MYSSQVNVYPINKKELLIMRHCFGTSAVVHVELGGGIILRKKEIRATKYKAVHDLIIEIRHL